MIRMLNQAFSKKSLIATSCLYSAFSFINSCNASGITIEVDPEKSVKQTSVISGTGPLLKKGLGEFVSAVENTYTGGTVINEGTFTVTITHDSVSNKGSLGAYNTDDDAVALNGSSMLKVPAAEEQDVDGNPYGLLNLNFPHKFSILDASAKIYVGQSSTLTLSGIIDDKANVNGNDVDVGFLKDGAGTLVLSGVGSTYKGDSRVLGGELQISAAENLGDTNALKMSPGTTLHVTNTLTLNKPIELGSAN